MNYAHAKGMIAGNEDGGVLIIHSSPNFVNISADGLKIKLFLENSSYTFGQHFFCLNLDLNTLNNYAA